MRECACACGLRGYGMAVAVVVVWLISTIPVVRMSDLAKAAEWPHHNLIHATANR